MRASRAEEASAVAKKIGDIIKRNNHSGLKISTKVWSRSRCGLKYKRYPGCKMEATEFDGLTADSFNQHYRVAQKVNQYQIIK